MRSSHYAKFLAAFSVGACLSVAPVHVFAEETVKTTMTLLQVKIEKDGKESLIPTKEASPGDTIEYRIISDNQTQQPVKNLVVTGTIPKDMTYVPKSASGDMPAKFEVSIDNTNTWISEPAKRKEKNEKGEMVEVVIPESEYTNIRWNVQGSLDSKKSITYKYRATLKK